MTVLAVLSSVGAACGAQAPAPSQAAPSTGSTPVADSVPATSQVRIVRLSQVQGQVRLDRQTGQKFEEAFSNLPIVGGDRLQTLTGVAEVEFEDNTSLRLTPNSLVEFPTLAREASGSTVSSVTLLSGTMYVSLMNGKGLDGYTIHAGNQTITPGPSSHFRLDMAAPAAELVVLKGNVSIAGPAGTMVVSKKQTLRLDTASGAPPVVAHNDAHNDGPAMYDKWDKTQADYHQVNSTASSFANSPYAYGTNDLSYYGSFASFGGCGMLWRPYLADAAWDPYGSGVWSLYPGAGYSWVSPYPWGWTPYHSGSWEFCPSSGWGWRPGGGWNGLNNVAVRRPVQGRPLAPEPPRVGGATIVPVNLKAMPVSRSAGDGSFVFAGGSAGFGVPRGAFDHLAKISQKAEQHGSVTTMVSESQSERGMIPASAHPTGTAANNTVSVARTAGGPGLAGASRGPSASAGAAHGGSSGGGGHH